jgi:hypothetical protein
MNTLTLLKKNIGWLAVFLLLVLAESFFDIGEVALGLMMKSMNNARPKIGRLWMEEERDVAGRQSVTLLADSLANHPFRTRTIRNLEDLAAYLNYKNKLLVLRNEFMSLYQAIPDSESRQLLDPMLLEDLSRDENWYSVSMSAMQGQVTCLFLDGFGQPLLVTHVGRSTQPAAVDTTFNARLSKEPRFSERIIRASLFLSAFARLPQSLRLQLINDPEFLTQNRDSLICVGVAGDMKDGTTTLACEMKDTPENRIVTFESSEIAIMYLIQIINESNKNVGGLALPRKGVEL